MSGISVANLLRDVREFNYIPYAERDVLEAIDALHEYQPLLFSKDFLHKCRELIAPHLISRAEALIADGTSERGDVQLFPPGRTIHLYRDGVGFSATFVPNTFFSEIDVSRRMINDHVFHTGYEQALLELMRQYHGDHHFRFNEDANVKGK